MKFGVLSYDFPFKRASNVGDYIQSYAALGVLGKTLDEVSLVNREKLNSYTGSELTVVMNGWYMHQPSSWPPGPGIDPIFVALHVNPSVYEAFSTPQSAEYLKRHQPIGCRDHSTRRFCESLGIEAYFSGCLTLTLDRSTCCESDDRRGVLLCDVVHGKGSFESLFDRDDISTLGKLARLPRVAWEKLAGVNGDRVLEKIRAAVGTDDVKMLTTQLSTSLTELERFAQARRYLEIYASSSLVITSRIHAALPCLAFGTPVLFINPGIDESRFDGIEDLFTTMSSAEILSQSTEELSDTLANVTNPDSYKTIRQQLKRSVAAALEARRKAP